jgi:16S rRNA (adenine1518-N6/adenine1519-N6)-dimethyltransferase
VRARKRFGQHFLEAAWVRKLVELIDPRPGERFLEIGPGRGALTLAIAERGASVLAIEVDRDLAADLQPRLPPGVTLHVADVLEVDLVAWLAGHGITAERPVRVAANLPYNISTPVLLQLLDASRQAAIFSDAALMLQHEVAERVLAGPGTGDYGPLAIAIRLSADGRRLLTLPPGAFRPPPKVHSAVVALTFRPPTVDVGDRTAFDRLVRQLFTLRRKTVANALRAALGGDGDRAARALGEAGIDGRRRPETLALDELAALARALGSADAGQPAPVL